MKVFNYSGTEIQIENPDNLVFQNGFYHDTYRFAYGRLTEGDYLPQIDLDELHDGKLGFDIGRCALGNDVTTRQPSAKATNPERLLTHFRLQLFLNEYPDFLGFFNNLSAPAEISIKNAERLLGAPCDSSNFIDIKRVIDDINRKIWTREKDVSERQAGVSNLGTISESLLASAFEGMVDDINFFKVSHSQVQSYGDFVLMCLPNNLWVSVKSNFARERLLASGYNNDILGVGFFESAREFTGSVRVRNFQRAGFLAMYCPDFPVSEAQLAAGSSTYDEIEAHHAGNGTDMPRNINGKPFIRKLSELRNDLLVLLGEADIRRRFTVGF